MSVINGLTDNVIKVQTIIVSDFWSLQKESFKVLHLKNPSEVFLEKEIMAKHRMLCGKKQGTMLTCERCKAEGLLSQRCMRCVCES